MPLTPMLLLSLIQGITEFLPVSSSGHLNLFQSFLNITPSLSFDVFLNTATLFSVIFVFRRQLKDFFKNLSLIALGTLPAALIGLLFSSPIDSIFSQTQYLPLFFLFTSILLFSLKFIKTKNQPFTPLKVLIIGLFQALALFPGVSRSAATLFAALLVGLSPQSAFKFSFYLFIPASLGALLLNIDKINSLSLSSFQPLPSLTGFLTAFLVGVLCLHLLLRLLISRRLWLFGFYTLSLACLILFFV